MVKRKVAQVVPERSKPTPDHDEDALRSQPSSRANSPTSGYFVQGLKRVRAHKGDSDAELSFEDESSEDIADTRNGSEDGESFSSDGSRYHTLIADKSDEHVSESEVCIAFQESGTLINQSPA